MEFDVVGQCPNPLEPQVMHGEVCRQSVAMQVLHSFWYELENGSF